MDGKKILQRIKQIETQVRHLYCEKRRWTEIATNITSVISEDRVQSTGDTHRMESAVVDGLVRDSSIDDKIRSLMQERQELIDIIEQLPEAESDVLYRCYVEYQPLKAIAIDRHESYSWITTLHGIALKKVAKQYATLCERKQLSIS